MFKIRYLESGKSKVDALGSRLSAGQTAVQRQDEQATDWKLGQNAEAEQREAVVEGSFSKKLRRASYCAMRGAMTVASIIIGIGAEIGNWHEMVEVSFSGFIGAILAFAIEELLTAWSDKKTTEALLKLARASREATEETVELGRVPPIPISADIPRPWLFAALKGVCFAAGSIPPLLSAVLIKNYTLRMWMVVVVATTIFLLTGIVGGFLEKASVVHSPVRVVVAGWFSIGISFAFSWIFDRIELG
ncbi:hypothetical protein CDL15_Pgr027017 [Punica granatum]|uniref:Vacuolar iron transporter n=1 Tax=Punica granatum TaxID=22663 RepID=A0A218WFB6_PUNGR|nr:hypothetical protein CDL15_Pgr027017 [Punica granatum]